MIKQKAFTIIELLVVIGIISILTAILLPTLARARAQGDNLKCKTNLHQYAIALEEYVGDNKDYFPNPKKWLYRKLSSGFCQWHDKDVFPAHLPSNAGSMWEYLDTPEVHLCPTFRKLSKTRGIDHPYHYEHDIDIIPQFSYTMNVHLGRNTDEIDILKTSQASKPARLFTFSEQNMWSSKEIALNVMMDSALHINDINSVPMAFEGQNFASYHNIINNDYNKGSANALFLDGHVGKASPHDDPFSLVKP